MTTNLLLAITRMEKKYFAPKGGCLMQLDGSRFRQDIPSLGAGTQVSAPSYPKPKAQRRSRRDPPGTNAVVNFRPEPCSQKNSASKGNRKGKNAEAFESVDDKDDAGKFNPPAEFGSLQLPGGKKHNLNHLLSFHFAPRETQQHGRGGGRFHNFHSSRTAVRPRQMHDSFIQANCQFVVLSDDDVEYHVDLPMDWKSVEQIIMRTCGATTCPICLSYPAAAKITKCGHIFCYSCILRYFSYADGPRSQLQPCPICFQLISQLELKSVLANLVDEVHVGDMVKLELMCIKKDGLASSEPISSKLNIASAAGWEKRFQKILKLTPQMVQSEVLEKEHLELSVQLGSTIESLETEFVLAALAELEVRTKLLSNKINNSTSGVKDERERRHELNAGTEVGVAGSTNIAEFAASTVNPTCKNRINWEEYSCFYQAADGTNTFMTSLNMAMLWKSFGPNLPEWPQTINHLKVVEIEILTVTTELRKRFKFLQDVPLGSSIQLLEFDLKGTVGKNVLEEFSHQLIERKRRRSERIRVEKRRDKMQREAERRANSGPEKPKIESFYDFPECRSPEAEAQALEYAFRLSLVQSENEALPENTNVISDVQQRRPCSSLSFAQALNTPSQWKPTYSSNASASNSAALTLVDDRVTSDSQLDQTESHVPAFRASVADAIASAFANFSLAGSSVPGESSSGQKKKGKKKGKVLFATAMGMGNN